MVKRPPRILTPVSEGRNLGPVTESELVSLGITSLEQVRSLGWEVVCTRYAEGYPERLNLNAFAAIIGAIEDQDWRKIDATSKRKAKMLIRALKRLA